MINQIVLFVEHGFWERRSNFKIADFVKLWISYYHKLCHNGISAPSSKNAVSAFQLSSKLLSFTLKDSWRNQQTINALPHLKTVSTIPNIQPFTTAVDWPEIGCLMEISTMFYIRRYCIFTWGGRMWPFDALTKLDFWHFWVCLGYMYPWADHIMSQLSNHF